VYAVIILAGVIFHAMRSVRSGLGPVVTYFVVAVGLVFAFGSSPAQLSVRPSIVKQAGGQVEPMKPPTVEGISLPTGFLVVNNGIHDLSVWLMKAFKEDFAVSPFAALMSLNALATERFHRDPVLQDRLWAFHEGCFGGALQKRLQDDAAAGRRSQLQTIDTPAGAALVPYYATLTFEDASGNQVLCSTQWEALKPDLARYTRENIHDAGTWLQGKFVHLVDDETLTTWALRNFRREAEPAGGAKLNPAWQNANPVTKLITGVTSWGLGALANFWNPIALAQVIDFFQHSAYVVYGYTLLVVYAFFPIVLALSLWPGQAMRFVNYLVLLMSLKLWPVVWAMLAAAHERVLPAFLADNVGGFNYPALLQVVTSLMVFGAPGLLSLVLGVAMHRIGSEMSSWAPGQLPIVGQLGGAGRAK
jgi:hypothetical protein